MSVCVCWVRYITHLRGGSTVNGPKSCCLVGVSRRTVTGVAEVRGGTSKSMVCFPGAMVPTALVCGVGHALEVRRTEALEKPSESMETTSKLRSPPWAWGTSGETASLTVGAAWAGARSDSANVHSKPVETARRCLNELLFIMHESER